MPPRLSDVVAAVEHAAERRGASAPPLLASVLDALRADHGDLDGPDPLERVDRLADRFDLDPVDQRVLGTVASVELDSNLALACTLLAGHDAPGWPTTALVLELCGLGTLDVAVRTRLNPLAPLRRLGLLDMRGDGPWLTRRLVVPPRVGAHLAGDDTLDATLLPCLVEPGGHAVAGSPELVRALAAGVRLCWVRSPLGATGPALAQAAVRAGGSEPIVIDLSRAWPDPLTGGLAGTVRAAVVEAGLRDRPLVLLEAHALVEPGREPAMPLLLASVVPVIGVSSRAWDPAWLPLVPVTVDAPPLGPRERVTVWGSAVEGSGLVVEPEAPAWQDLLGMRLAPEQIERAATEAELTGVLEDRPVVVDDLRDAVRRSHGAAPDGPSRTPATFDDLVLPPAAMGELRRLVSWARHRDQVLAQGPLHGAGGKGTGIAAMFAGGPGTGKTLAAHVVADALGLDLMRIDLSSTVDKYIGETEKNLERAFHEAESMNVVLFFDEADALFGSRSAVSDSRDRYANLEVSYLLQRMESFDGITVLATNLRGNLDPAFSRRLHFIVTFTDPDAETRLELWQRLLGHVDRLDETDPPDLPLLAEHAELAGGDIRNIVLAAAYDAADDNDGAVAMRHLVTAAGREFTKVRKRMPPQLARWGG
ncbi:ATP-binding protein [Nocardioides litoris]|uniref:ATP-binding protein n=1 Tax=Nocardioides litoris TaxID=1926648 RepID=UPI00111CC6D2|nr:ATP-binding protein [Nocardioides litoris]